jgi:hypothetical protein
MDAYFAARADQPFGDAELVSGRTLSAFSRAGLTAADNLLAKADRALAAGDLQRARRFVDRAATLPYDEHEQTAPAAYAASMLLFTAVTDTLERSPEGDSSWLDAAVEALSSNDGCGQSRCATRCSSFGRTMSSSRARAAPLGTPRRQCPNGLSCAMPKWCHMKLPRR